MVCTNEGPGCSGLGPFSCPYSPECVEGASSEVRTRLRWMACKEVLEGKYGCTEEV